MARGIDGPIFLLCDECQLHFDTVRNGLSEENIPFDDSKVFARGLDYYTRTVFEVRSKGLGSQDAVAAGGRYDHLVEELGGPSIGAVGFAAGIERVLMAAEYKKAGCAQSPKRNGLYLAIARATFLGHAFRMVQQLRKRGLNALIDYDAKSLKSQLRAADKANCQLVAILGELEASKRLMTVKDMESGTERMVPFDTFTDEIAKQLTK